MTREGQRGLWTLRCCLTPNLCPHLNLLGAKQQVYLGTSLYHGDGNVGLFLEAEDTAMLSFPWLQRGKGSTFPLSPVGERKLAGDTMGRRSSSATLAWEDVLGSRAWQILAFGMWDTCWVLALV